MKVNKKKIEYMCGSHYKFVATRKVEFKIKVEVKRSDGDNMIPFQYRKNICTHPHLRHFNQNSSVF